MFLNNRTLLLRLYHFDMLKNKTFLFLLFIFRIISPFLFTLIMALKRQKTTFQLLNNCVTNSVMYFTTTSCTSMTSLSLSSSLPLGPLYLSICFFPSSVEIMQPLTHLFGRITSYVATKRLTYCTILDKFSENNQTVRLSKLLIFKTTSKRECTKEGARKTLPSCANSVPKKISRSLMWKGTPEFDTLFRAPFCCSCEIKFRRKTLQLELSLVAISSIVKYMIWRVGAINGERLEMKKINAKS